MNREFLQGLGLNDEQIAAALEESDKDITREKQKLSADSEKLADERDKLKTQLEQANASLKELSKLSGDVEDYKAKIAQFEQAERERADAERAEQEKNTLLAAFNAAVGDKKFVNDYTKNAIFENVCTELSKDENKGKGIEELFKTLTDDKEGIFQSENPTYNAGSMDGVGNAVSEEQISAIMGIC